MNKKIESLQKEINKIETAKAEKTAKIESEIAAIDQELTQCDAKMKDAVNSDDFAAFEKLGARKSFLQNRKELFAAALKETGNFSRTEYNRLRDELIGALNDSAENVKKELVKHAAVMGSLGDSLVSEKETVQNLLTLIAGWARVESEIYPLDGVINVYRWACGVKMDNTYTNAVREHPEWVPAKK